MVKETLKDRIEYAIEMKHDVIFTRDGKYMSGSWEDEKHAVECGWVFMGTVADLFKMRFKEA